MKTTVEISDALFTKVRRYAARKGLTLKAVVELGLRRVVDETPAAKPFQLRRASFSGSGLQRGMQSASWDQIRSAAYEGRGE